MRIFRNQQGVAMITVLFVGAALTATASAAAFMTISDLRASNDDSRGTDAFAISEAGVDRMILYIKSGVGLDTGTLKTSGCDRDSDGTVEPNEIITITGDLLRDSGVAVGTYSVDLEVYPLTPAECTARAGLKSLLTPKRYAITSEGCVPQGCAGSPTAVSSKRVIRQLVDIKLRGLPIAIYADNVRGTGGPEIRNISLLSPGDIENRDNIGFEGSDPFYTIDQFWPDIDPSLAGVRAPSALHAVGTAYCNSPNKCQPTEHGASLSTLNCQANRDQGQNAGTSGQSMWDQTGGGGAITAAACSNWTGTPTGPPPNSLMTAELLNEIVPEVGLTDEDYLLLKTMAQETGIYCRITTAGAHTCFRGGQPWATGDSTLQGDLINTLPKNLIVYYEYQTYSPSNGVDVRDSWPTGTPICSTDPANRKFITMVIRNGNFFAAAGTQLNGSLFIPEGELRDAGGFTFNGAVIAKTFRKSGNSIFTLDDCWVGNMPSLFITITPIRWQEIDR